MLEYRDTVPFTRWENQYFDSGISDHNNQTGFLRYRQCTKPHLAFRFGFMLCANWSLLNPESPRRREVRFHRALHNFQTTVCGVTALPGLKYQSYDHYLPRDAWWITLTSANFMFC